MNILFYCPFKFSLKSKNIKSLGGIESLNIDLGKNLSKSYNNLYLATFCNKEVRQGKLTNIPIKKLTNKMSNYKFDKIISSNDPTIFNLSKNTENFLWLHNKLPIEKAFRKKKLFSILRNKISCVFVSNYLKKNTPSIYNFKSKYVIPNFINTDFTNNRPKFLRKPYFVWSVQRKKGLHTILDIWKNKVYNNNNQAKLFIFGISKNNISKKKVRNFYQYNIFFKGRVSKKELIKQYNVSMGMICLGYDETFCINIIEAFACGLPVITFGFTAVSELVNNKNSFKMNNFNDFEKIIFNILNMKNFKRKDYINYCYEYSKRYHLKKILPLWKKIIRS